MWENWRRPGWEQKEEKTEYDVYRLSVREILWGLCKSAAVTGTFAYLFYRSWAGCLAWPVTAVLCLKGDRKRKQKQRKERLSAQFCDAIQAAASGMQAGYSVENAFLEAEREIRALHGDGCEMAEELAAVGKESWMGGAVSGKFENRALSGRMAMPHRSALENLPFRAAAG